MRRLSRTLIVGLFVLLFLTITFADRFVSQATAMPANSGSTQATPAPSSIEPGDTVNGITVNRVTQPDDTIPYIGNFCTSSDAANAALTTFLCDVPTVMDRVYLVETYGAQDTQTLNAMTNALSYEITLDGRPFDLAAFGTLDTPPGDQGPGQNRNYFFELANLTPGKHLYRRIMRISKDFGTLKAGISEARIAINIGSENFATPCPQLDTLSASTPEVTAPPGTREAGQSAYLGISYAVSSCGDAVGEVEPDSPALTAGLMANDVILAVNGVSVWDLPNFKPLPVGAQPHQPVIYTIQRGSRTMRIVVTLGTLPS